MTVLKGVTDCYNIWSVDNHGDLVLEDPKWTGEDGENYKTLLTKQDLQKMLQAIEKFESEREIEELRTGIHHLYDFCLNWQMGYFDHSQMKKDFFRFGWGFEEFYFETQKRGWWVSSMQEIGK